MCCPPTQSTAKAVQLRLATGSEKLPHSVGFVFAQLPPSTSRGHALRAALWLQSVHSRLTLLTLSGRGRKYAPSAPSGGNVRRAPLKGGKKFVDGQAASRLPSCHFLRLRARWARAARCLQHTCLRALRSRPVRFRHCAAPHTPPPCPLQAAATCPSPSLRGHKAPSLRRRGVVLFKR